MNPNCPKFNGFLIKMEYALLGEMVKTCKGYMPTNECEHVLKIMENSGYRWPHL